ncbi:MAG: Holliday junction branch migration protein RuvA [Fimbriimonadales bacterium]
MIGRLRGKVWDIEAGLVTLDVVGVGYEISVPESVLVQLPKDEAAELYIRQVFREDGVSLYGFLTSYQRRLFDLLMTVKGCGPKVALSLLGLGEDSVASAILAQDPKVLIRATGVGARLAERILLELKEKIQEEALLRKVGYAVASTSSKSAPSDELIAALLALGYRRQEAEAAAEGAREQADAVEDQLKIALRALARS